MAGIVLSRALCRRIHRGLFISLFLAGACTRASGGVRAETIVRIASYPDAALAARNRGNLDVIVRSTDQPTQVLSSARVLLRIGPRDSVLSITDDRGIARFDAITVGEHELIVRRIGYGLARALISVKPGCRTDAEAYVAISAIGIDPPPPMPGRVVQTTCK